MSDKDSGDAQGKKQRASRLEGVIPELLKRAVELGVEKAVEAPDNLKELVGGLKVPKEIAHLLLSQVEETKNGLFRVVGNEVRDFLEKANLAGEMQKMLTSLQFEINTTIRFKPNEGEKGDTDEEGQARVPKPEVSTEVSVKRDRDDRAPRRRSRE